METIELTSYSGLGIQHSVCLILTYELSFWNVIGRGYMVLKFWTKLEKITEVCHSIYIDEVILHAHCVLEACYISGK